MIKMLTDLGVDGAKEDSLKQTPIFYACREGNNEAIRYLVDGCKDYVNRQDKYGQTCVYYAAREGHVSTIKLLIDLGADIDHADTKN